MKKSSIVVVLLAACTGGVVLEQDGTAVPTGTVTFLPCATGPAPGPAAITNGTFSINSTAAFTPGAYVPVGNEVITTSTVDRATGRTRFHFAAVNHQYDQTCEINGQTKLCKKYALGLGFNPVAYAGQGLTPVQLSPANNQFPTPDAFYRATCGPTSSGGATTGGSSGSTTAH